MTASTSYADRQRSAALILLVLVTAITVELVRASGPLLDHAFASGVVTVAMTALITFAAPGALVTLLVARLRVTGRVVLAGVVALTVARLALQGLGTAIGSGANLGLVRYGAGLVAVALALGVLVLVAAFVGAPGDADTGAGSPVTPVPASDRKAAEDADGFALARGARVALGVGLGTLAAAAVSLLLGTWDAFWRTGPLGWAPAVVLTGGALWCAWTTRTRAAAPGPRGLWVLGPYLALMIQILANPAFVAAQAGVALPFAAFALAAAAPAVGWFVVRRSGSRAASRRGLRPWGDAVVVVAGLACCLLLVPRVQGPGAAGWAVLVVLAALVPVTTWQLGRALTRPTHDLHWLRVAGSASAVGLGMILPLLLFQLDYDVPLPVPNAWVPVLAAAAVAVPGALAAGRLPVATQTRGRRAARRAGRAPDASLALVAGGAVGALALVGVTQVDVPTTTNAVADYPPGALRVLNWNLHYGVSADPSVDLDEMVRTIDESGADVVTLQEVSRGWVLGGGADMATYLARHTGMRVAFVPAADRQFGNALLWDPLRGDLADVARIALPYGAGPQERSAISATVDAAGIPVRVTSVHLQHREENTPTRLEQLAALFVAEPVEGAYVLAGDFNAEPGWEEIDLVEQQGLSSGQDEAGEPGDATSPAVGPVHRIDWIFGSEPVEFREVAVLDEVASDHRPLLAELTATATS